jgi:hypothetical protein
MIVYYSRMGFESAGEQGKCCSTNIILNSCYFSRKKRTGEIEAYLVERKQKKN